MNQLFLNLIMICIYTSLLSLVALIYWIRDYIREYSSKYESVIILISVALISVLISESLLFATLFWSLFQPFCSFPMHSLEGVYTSDPSCHAFSNTVILSNASISLGYILIIRDSYKAHIHSMIAYVWLIALIFIHIQIKEFYNITVSMNESIYVTIFFSLLGLHLFHIIIGTLIITLILWTNTHNKSVITFISLLYWASTHQLTSTVQLIYWHFVDVIWLVIYYLLYN